MKSFLKHRAKRWDYDGWALLMPGAANPLWWTVSTTRQEARELRKEQADLFERGAEIVKVRLSVEVVRP